MQAGMMAAAACAAMLACAEDPQPAQQTSAAQGIQTGSGSNSYDGGGNVLGSDGALAGGTTIGSGVDTTGGSAVLTVDEGTLMFTLAPKAADRARTKAAPRRKQLYGLNPHADDTASGNPSQ
jgi:hypothetical protein